MRILAIGLALSLAVCGSPPATAKQRLPVYGVITITDEGFGPRGTWSYDGVFSCDFRTDGPFGIPNVATVRCSATQTPLGVVFACPRMLVGRTTATVVGARATCAETLDMGIGTSGLAMADLGIVTAYFECTAYMEDSTVLVPPYQVTCAEPGLPEVDLSLPSATTS